MCRKLCKNCGESEAKKYSKESGGDFCSIKCAKAFGTKNDDKSQTKETNCISCGKVKKVNKRKSCKNFLCSDCLLIKSNKDVLCVDGRKIKRCKICGTFNCSHEVCKKYRLIKTLIKYFGFSENVLGSLEVLLEYERIKNKLREDYLEKEMSLSEISSKYGFGDCRNLNKIFKSLSIELRSFSQSQTVALKKGKKSLPGANEFYKSGWHETWNNKKVFYRSSYELNYCFELDINKIDYEMECLKIQYWDSQKEKNRIAIPDFYLPTTNTIVEIKSD